MQTAQFAVHEQLEATHWWFVARRRILRRLLAEVLPPDPQTTVIDVGCGTGANIASLAGDYRCLGIDTSPDAIAAARRRFPQVEFLLGQAPDDLGPRAAEAKAWLLMDVLEHVPDDFAMLSRLFAAAAPGSYFLITVPADRRLWSVHDESFGHYRRYDRRRLERLWQHLPVRPLLVSHFNARLYPIIRLVRWLHRRRNRAAGTAGTDFSLPPRWANRILEQTLAGETKALLDKLRGRGRGYQRGVSLVALIERRPGPVHASLRPADVEPDLFDPTTGRHLADALA